MKVMLHPMLQGELVNAGEHSVLACPQGFTVDRSNVGEDGDYDAELVDQQPSFVLFDISAVTESELEQDVWRLLWDTLISMKRLAMQNNGC